MNQASARPPSAGDQAGADRAFRRLALATIVATFVLVVVGGIVRVSGSGLGCGPAGSGFHGWPFCNGDVVPGVDLNSIIEYTHRALAGVVGLMMLALAILAWRRYRSQRALVQASVAAFALVVVQGLLGAATVEEGLEETLVAAHLGLAMVLLALLVYIWRAARPQNVGADPADGGRGFKPLALVAAALALCAILAGGYMAGTQKYGTATYQLGDGAHHACGKEFPSCNGEFLPFGQTRLVDIHLTHRVLVYLTFFAVLALVGLALRRRPSEGIVRVAWGALAILLAQMLVGALNVWLDEYELLIVTHLALGTLLWTALAGIAFQLFRIPEPVESRPGASPRETLPA